MAESISDFGKLTFVWEGAFALIDANIDLTLNGNNVGGPSTHYSFKEGFNVEAQIDREDNHIGILMPPKVKYDCDVKFRPEVNYVCRFSYNRFLGALTYKISEEGGAVVFEKGTSKARKAIVGVGLVFIALCLVAWIGIKVLGLDNRESKFVRADDLVEEVVAVEECDEYESVEECKEYEEQEQFVGSYEFSDEHNVWEVTLYDDKTCTIINRTTEEEVCYGSWEHSTYSSYILLKFGDVFPKVWLSGESHYKIMDFIYLPEDMSYIYKDRDALEAKNPNKRLPLRKIY